MGEEFVSGKDVLVECGLSMQQLIEIVNDGKVALYSSNFFELNATRERKKRDAHDRDNQPLDAKETGYYPKKINGKITWEERSLIEDMDNYEMLIRYGYIVDNYYFMRSELMHVKKEMSYGRVPINVPTDFVKKLLDRKDFKRIIDFDDENKDKLELIELVEKTSKSGVITLDVIVHIKIDVRGYDRTSTGELLFKIDERSHNKALNTPKRPKKPKKTTKLVDGNEDETKKFKDSRDEKNSRIDVNQRLEKAKIYSITYI